MENQANLGVWEDPQDPGVSRSSERLESATCRGAGKAGGCVPPLLLTKDPPASPPSRDPVEPPDREEAAGAALAHCWLCPRAEPPAGSFHPGSISSRAPGGIKSDLSSL